ncbi:hypothetical protein D9758_002120 [Tetrapyrgos nigripes]|uniref:HCP-like protein n=1 Tax=Tetrapyrgos nigripes TaxID=182062 RepID=A0A8H5LV66_9AGAR|nr:hypothetical protein D9758_002120 [Tetrapyrgos nigripes]
MMYDNTRSRHYIPPLLLFIMMAGPVNSQPPPSFNVDSPLDTLVRRTSSRRAKHPPSALSNAASYPPPAGTSSSYFPYNPQQHDHSEAQLSVSTPPRAGHRNYPNPNISPVSPLLHSHFARDSVATNSSRDNNSFLDFSNRESVDSRNIYQENIGYAYYDDASVYSDNSALRDSWQSGGTIGPGSALDHSGSDRRGMGSSFRTDTPDSPHSPDSPVPTVVITMEHEMPVVSPGAGRVPIVRPRGASVSNFSRPSAAPVLMPAEEQKQMVLQRNASRRNLSNHPSSSNHSVSSYPSPSSSSPSFSPGQILPRSHSDYSMRSVSPSHMASPSTMASGQLSHITSHLSLRDSLPSSSSSSPISPSPSSQNLSVHRSNGPLSLPRKPPSIRPDSPVSLYSTYSYYNYDSATPSPTGTGFKLDSPSGSGSRSPLRSDSTQELVKQARLQPAPTDGKAQEFLQLGIQHHEANRLGESAVYFERSAKEEGGCGVGKLMWGLTLRHGWGCDKNEKEGFKWLRKAAEEAVDDLEKATRGDTQLDRGAVRAELILAIYEVGQCFFHGWGVPKDQKMAVKYYRVAAGLGDADAQNDLGFCLANGKGCKKDRKEAAKWYKLAVAQGASDVGLAWIYKEKFQ